VLSPDAVGLDKGRVTWSVGTDYMCGSSCPSRESKPDPESEAQRIGASRGDRGHDLTIAQKEGATILSYVKVIMDVMARDCTEGAVSAEPFIKSSSQWHLFPVDVAFTTTKDINFKLGLESPKVLNL